MKKNYHFKCQRLLALLFAFLIAIVAAVPANAQNLTLKGKVVSSEDKLPLPGVGVKVKGSSTGTTTDVEGNFAISGKVGDVLVFSFIGFKEKQVTVSNSNTITVRLETDVANLEEVVVIGYGVQKKKLTTGANLQVKGDDIEKQSSTNALQALQGQTPGVQITTTSGQPGSGINVTIRGRGTIGGSNPLYVVDGLVGVDITTINPSDIESIDVLKDAASAAIYGSQASNGVILVTTKTGKKGQQAQITFDAYSGTQQVANKVRMLNSKEYATIMNEEAINSGKSPYFTNAEIAKMGEGTNWLDQMFVDNAATQNYVVGAQGASTSSVYSASLAYTSQEGLVGGKDLSNYDRYNFKINTEHNLYKDILKVGQHLNFVYRKDNGIGVGNQYNNTLRGAFNTSPFLQMYDENGNFFNNKASTWNNGESNPYASMVYNNQNRNNNQNLFGDIYASIEPIKGLQFRTSLGLNYGANEGRSFTPIYELSIYAFNDNTRVSQSLGKNKSIQWDNLLTYKFKLQQKHDFEIMAGSSSISRDGSSMYGSNRNLVFADLDHAWLNNATNKDGTLLSLNGSPFESKLMSYYGRIQYNFEEKYLFNASLRADGSSNFAKGNRWGYFPAVSAGWIVTSEPFLEGSRNWLDYLKIRASFGQVGNQNIAGYQYLAPIRFDFTNYTFGNQEGVLTPGAYPNRLANEDVSWEASEQINIGFDARFINNKFNLNADYYVKSSKDWLIVVPVLATAGADAPFINGGDVKNSGLELALTYNNTKGKFNYSIGLNGAYNKNQIGNIPTADHIIHPDINHRIFDNSASFYRAENGYPVGYFRGFKTNGIFQTEQEVASYRSASGMVIQPSAAPGDVRFVDINGDGMINDSDKTMIGSPHPDYTFGLNLSANYKGFDFYMLASGVAGNQILQSWRNQANAKANYSTAILSRWHGPGSSNTMPRVTEDSRNFIPISDLYIQDGDFLRISNVTLGYDLSKLTKKSYLSKVRLYASALNLYTFTKYNGMDPEIGYGEGFSSGVDLGYYPRPRTFLLGANVKF